MAGLNIELVEDGPYRIADSFQLLDTKRNPIQTHGLVELCRCGDSKNKPFCDELGCKKGFQTADENVPENRREYTGVNISVSFDASRCIHVAECLSNAPDVFDVKKRPWINLEGADMERVARVVQRCPSGELQYRRLHRSIDEEPDQPATIRVTRNGPYYLRGEIEITGPKDGQRLNGNQLALCRCGSSRNKPFCDNSHRMVGFRAS